MFYEPERPLEPREEEVDGYLVCCECDEVIPGGEWYYEFGNEVYCSHCVEDHMHLAPYRSEE